MNQKGLHPPAAVSTLGTKTGTAVPLPLWDSVWAPKGL
jgi:hypothetical protein